MLKTKPELKDTEDKLALEKKKALAEKTGTLFLKLPIKNKYKPIFSKLNGLTTKSIIKFLIEPDMQIHQISVMNIDDEDYDAAVLETNALLGEDVYRLAVVDEWYTLLGDFWKELSIVKENMNWSI